MQINFNCDSVETARAIKRTLNTFQIQSSYEFHVIDQNCTITIECEEDLETLVELTCERIKSLNE